MSDPQFWSTDLHDELRLLRRRLAELEAHDQERARVEERLRRQNRCLSVLSELTATLMRRLDPADLLSGILDRVNSLLDTPHSFIALADPETNTLVVRAATGSIAPAIGTRISGNARSSEAFAHCHAIAEVTLRSEEETLGILGVARIDEKPFDEWDFDVLDRFGELAAIALRNAHLFEAEHEARDQGETLLEAAKAVNSSLRLHEVLQAILEQLGRVIPCDSASVQEIRDDASVVIAGIGFENPEAIIGLRFDIANPEIPNGKVVQTRTPMILHDISPFSDFRKASPTATHVRSWMGVPLIAADRVVGLLTVDKNDPSFYNAEHARLAVAFAAQAAIAIENARLYAASREEILERKRITERLHQSEASYQTLVEQLPAITYRWSVSDKNTGYISPQVESLLGYTPEEWLGDPDLWWKVLHPDDRQWVIDAMIEKDATGKDLDVTHRLVARDGRVLWFQNQSKTVFDDGKPRETHGVMLDVTHLKQVEENLRQARLEAERRAEQLAALNRVAAALANVAGIDSALQTVACELVHIADARSCGITLIDEERNSLRVVADYAIEGESVLGLLFPLIATNQSSVDVIELRTSIIVTDAQTNPMTAALHDLLVARGTEQILIAPLIVRGHAIGTIGIDTDRKDRQFGEADVRLLETVAGQVAGAIENARLFADEKQSRLLAERLQEIARVLNESLDLDVVLHAILDQIRQVIDYDMASIQLLDEDSMRVIAVRGVPETEIGRVRPLADYPYNRRLATDEQPVILEIGPDETTWRANLSFLQPIRCNIGIPMKAREGIIGALMLDSTKPGHYTEKDLRIATAFGRQAAVAVENARLYTDAQRELQERIRAEEEMVRAKEAADEANKAKSAFLAIMSHELRTPLNAIIGFSAVLDARLSPKLEEKQARFLRNINVSGEYLLHIINDILDLSKIEAGKMTIDPEEVDVAESIEAICRVVRGMALPRNIEIRTELATNLGSLWADPVRLKQILYNLLSNAVKFSPDGSTVVTRGRALTPADSPLHQESIEMCVIDEGPGIEPEHRQIIFEEFQQLQRDAKRPQGTGLGLALVNRLALLMGGTIRLRSEPGKGSEFSIILPRSGSGRNSKHHST